MRLCKFIVFALALAVFGGPAPKSLAATASTSGYRDMDLERTLRAALNRNPSLGSIESNVTHGTVTLTGEVTHYQDKLDAESLAHQLPSVRAVQSRITLNTAVLDDAELEGRLEDRLRYARADIGLTFPQVQVGAHKGIVSLTGPVKDPVEHASVLSLVATTDGVFSIRDGLSIEPSLASDEVTRARINKAVYRTARAIGVAGTDGTAPVQAHFDKGSVTLMGSVADAKAKEELLSRIRNADGALSVQDEVMVRNSTPAVQEATSRSMVPCLQNKDVASTTQ
ncbi:MAG TPA: BON domain-containing protein [Bryobacteraceae bacterium]|nr:BON domain-containing protein [Acidobacteriaceae bacterium]